MKTILTLLVALSLTTAAFSQKVYFNKNSHGDSLRFRFELPHRMRLKIYEGNKVIKEYEFKGAMELELITRLRHLVIYSDQQELRFYLLHEDEKVLVPAGMIIKQEISL